MKDKNKDKDFTEITISAEEYDKLLVDAIWLQCLESAGVDNWDGYYIAQEAFELYIDESCRLH